MYLAFEHSNNLTSNVERSYNCIHGYLVWFRDRQHGPVFELNRFGLKKGGRTKNNSGHNTSANNNPNSSINNTSNNNNNNNAGSGGGGEGSRTVFSQMVAKLGSLTNECLLLPHRVWKVRSLNIASKLIKATRKCN